MDGVHGFGRVLVLEAAHAQLTELQGDGWNGTRASKKRFRVQLRRIVPNGSELRGAHRLPLPRRPNPCSGGTCQRSGSHYLGFSYHCFYHSHSAAATTSLSSSPFPVHLPLPPPIPLLPCSIPRSRACRRCRGPPSASSLQTPADRGPWYETR